MSKITERVYDFSELITGQPVLYNENTEEAGVVWWNSKVEFICYDYCTLRCIDHNGDEVVALCVDTDNIRLEIEVPELQIQNLSAEEIAAAAAKVGL